MKKKKQKLIELEKWGYPSKDEIFESQKIFYYYGVPWNPSDYKIPRIERILPQELYDKMRSCPECKTRSDIFWGQSDELELQCVYCRQKIEMDVSHFELASYVLQRTRRMKAPRKTFERFVRDGYLDDLIFSYLMQKTRHRMASKIQRSWWFFLAKRDWNERLQVL